jgi:hypothetical protein
MGLDVRKPNDINILLTQLQEAFQPSVNRKQFELALRTKILEKRIATLRREKGFWRIFLNWSKISSSRKEIMQLPSEELHYRSTLSQNILRLQTLKESPELAGAQAELAVVAQLSRLPNDYNVFNNIHLESTRYIHFNGVPLQSAQIDHLVLSPAGVFVIETKRWSRNFVASGNYHDPFDQIQRASYLCYDIMREHFGEVRVRSIIACAGHLPSNCSQSYIKVLRLSELNSYILWFKQQELNADELSHLRGFFEQYLID